MLLAVERANGGELSGLEQVLVAFQTLFDRQMEPEGYARSCALLCEAGLVESAGEYVGLSPAGRKLLRRTGVPGSPERPHKVADQLGLLENLDLAPEGSVPCPSVAAFEAASASLGPDGEAGGEPMLGSELAPRPLGNLFPPGWVGPSPSPATRWRPLQRHAPVPNVPMVQPADPVQPEEPEETSEPERPGG